MKRPIQVISFKPIKEKFSIFNIEHLEDFNEEKTKLNNIEKLMRTGHLNQEEKYHIIKLCKEYSDIFHKENEDLTFTNEIKHIINTIDEIPVYTKSYRYPFIHKKEVKKQINKMLEQKIIRYSPIWIIPKKLDVSGKQKWRIVIDYRKVNEKTIEVLQQIILNCHNLITFLDNIENAIMFAKLKTAHNSILSIANLNKILNIVETLYSKDHIIQFKNILSYYYIIDTQYSFTKDEIIFSLFFPIFKLENFNTTTFTPYPKITLL